VVTAEPWHAQTVDQALEVAVPAVRREPGCIQYDLHRDQSNLGRFVMIEQWSDAKALKVHSDGAAFRQLSSVRDGRASLEVVDLARIV
jgi:quinol monooxygenase YgiN